MNEKTLDQLDDLELLYILSTLYGIHIPKWKKCSKKEYDKYNSKDFIEKLFISDDYKRVPVYKNFQPGILFQINNFDKKPDYYRYYKKVGSEFIIMVGSEIMNYLNKRKPNWLYKDKIIF